MSFISTFEELSKLYESVEPEVKEEEVVEESTEEELTEAVEEVDEADGEAEEDETDEVVELEAEEEQEEPKQLILECSNCGGLVIKAEADVAIDDESDLANVDEACQYCEETAGYKVLGAVIPYEPNEALEEGIFDRKPSAKQEELIDEFKNKAEKITKKPLNSVASDLTNLLKNVIVEYRVAWLKTNKGIAQTSIDNAFKTKAASVLKLYEGLIKSLAKPNNFYQAALDISNVAADIIEDFADQSSSYKKLQAYEDVLNQLSAIEVDKNTAKAVLKEFFSDLIYSLKDDLNNFKNRPAHTLFKESVSQDADEVEESLLDVNLPIDVDVQANGNDVSVGTLG